MNFLTSIFRALGRNHVASTPKRGLWGFVWMDTQDGEHTHLHETSRVWSHNDARLHISILEVRAVSLTLQRLNVYKSTIHLYIDSQIAFLAINKIRCKSPSLLEELQQLIQVFQSQALSVEAFRISSKFNNKADALTSH